MLLLFELTTFHWPFRAKWCS